MGLEQYDFLYTQAQTMLTNLNSLLEALTLLENSSTGISESLSTLSTSLDSVVALIGSNDLEGANTAIGAIKLSMSTVSVPSEPITTAKEGVGAAIVQVNELVPLITAEVEKYVDGKTTYKYKCLVCSANCDLSLKFVPLDKSILTTCLLDKKNSADFKQISVEVTN